jgi:very-short-patch-repair endonuclease
MPAKRSDPQTMHRAGELRRELTPAEKKLWAHLRERQFNGIKFRKQHALGRFIADFISIKSRLIIELDGSQHLDQAQYDVERTRYFESKGYQVLRFWNHQVMNDMNGAMRAIELALKPE